MAIVLSGLTVSCISLHGMSVSSNGGSTSGEGKNASLSENEIAFPLIIRAKQNNNGEITKILEVKQVTQEQARQLLKDYEQQNPGKA